MGHLKNTSGLETPYLNCILINNRWDIDGLIYSYFSDGKIELVKLLSKRILKFLWKFNCGQPLFLSFGVKTDKKTETILAGSSQNLAGNDKL